VTAVSTPAVSRLDGLVQRVLRCFSVSLLTTALSLTTLAMLTASLAATAWVANIVATAIGTMVSYRLNRRWVWGRRDASDPWREVVPFWVMSFAGLVLSTAAVATADAWAGSLHLSGDWRTLAVLTASVAGYAVLWVAQFVVLERVLFAPCPSRRVIPARPVAIAGPKPPAAARRVDMGEISIVDQAQTKERVR
jgi:putative flippase GtrA